LGLRRSFFYVWKAAYEREGAAGLVNKKSCAHTQPKATAACSSAGSRPACRKVRRGFRRLRGHRDLAALIRALDRTPMDRGRR
jgi:hypothetical protein